MKLKPLEILILGLMIIAMVATFALATDESLTITLGAKSLTASKYGNFQHGVCIVETAPIRFTMDGVSVPTSMGVGIQVQVGQSINFWMNDHLRFFSAVRDSSADSKLSCSYW